MKKITKKELKQKIKALGKIDLKTKKSVICQLIGHSRISTTFFGYRYCARCGALLGDSLGSIDVGVKNAVFVGHKCRVCQKNYKKCDWRDKLYCRDPFQCSNLDDKYKKLPYLETL